MTARAGSHPDFHPYRVPVTLPAALLQRWQNESIWQRVICIYQSILPRCHLHLPGDFANVLFEFTSGFANLSFIFTNPPYQGLKKHLTSVESRPCWCEKRMCDAPFLPPCDIWRDSPFAISLHMLNFVPLLFWKCLHARAHGLTSAWHFSSVLLSCRIPWSCVTQHLPAGGTEQQKVRLCRFMVKASTTLTNEFATQEYCKFICFIGTCKELAKVGRNVTTHWQKKN